MRFNSVKIVLKDTDEESAGVKLEFDPPMPADMTEEDLEREMQPCVVLAFSMIQSLEKLYREEMEITSSNPHQLH